MLNISILAFLYKDSKVHLQEEKTVTWTVCIISSCLNIIIGLFIGMYHAAIGGTTVTFANK